MVARHAVEHALARVAAAELIGLRQQRAFGRDGGDVAGEDVIGHQPVDDLLAGQPLGDGDRINDGAPLDHDVHDLAHARLRRDEILAGLDIALVAVEGDRHAEDPAIGDDAGILERLGDVAEAFAGLDGDDTLGCERPGLIELHLGEEAEAADDDHGENDDGQQEVQRDDQRVPRGARPRWRRRHFVRLQKLARAFRCAALRPIAVRRVPYSSHANLLASPRSPVGISDGRTKRFRAGRQASWRRNTSSHWCRRNRTNWTARSSMSFFFAVRGTRSILVSTDGLSRLSVGGTIESRIASRREDRLDRAGSAEQMADRRFGRRHGQMLGGIADQALHGAQFDLVAERRRGAVRVDVVDVLRSRCRRASPQPSCSDRRRRHRVTAR